MPRVMRVEYPGAISTMSSIAGTSGKIFSSRNCPKGPKNDMDKRPGGASAPGNDDADMLDFPMRANWHPERSANHPAPTDAEGAPL